MIDKHNKQNEELNKLVGISDIFQSTLRDKEDEMNLTL